MSRWLRHLPNLISSLRILLVVPIGWSLLEQRVILTLWLFFVAAASDAADGFLARRFGWQSELGGLLDPIADKLMLATAFVMLAYLSLVPRWLTAAVLLRDVVIVAGAVAYRVRLGSVKAAPSQVSKLNTLGQMLFILVVIGRQRFDVPPAWVGIALGAVVFVTVVVSGIDYVSVYARRAAQAGHVVSPGTGP